MFNFIEEEVANSEPSSKEFEKPFISVGAHCKLKLSDVFLLASKSIPVHLSPASYAAVEQSYHFLNSHIQQRTIVYGTNTQFGNQVNYLDPHLKDAEEVIYYESIHARQENLIRSHSCGLGEIISPVVIKLAMMLRVHCLAQGYSGVSSELLEFVLQYLNAGITPIVRQYGSIGASGDLIPLAMIATGILGEDTDVLYHGKKMKSSKAIEMTGLTVPKLQVRDGLAMINGTSFMTAIASLMVYHLNRLFQQMLYVLAMSLESMCVIIDAYHPLLHQLKHHVGEMKVNQTLLNFWKGSGLLTTLSELREASFEKDEAIVSSTKSVQDYYSLRSISQGFGAFQENLERAIIWIENEMNSVNDNPIIDVNSKQIYHGANFMGYYVTDVCDTLKMNIAQASTWIHALLANMVHPRKNHGLPANLVDQPAIHNGFRPLQLLAAALAVQNRKLAQAHQAFMLPTEGDNQDVSSLGTHAALDLQQSVENLERLVAILLLASVQALEFRGIEKASHKSQAIYEVVRSVSKKIENCRPMSEEIDAVINLLRERRI